MTPYLAQFECLIADYAFTETVRFTTEGDPHAFMAAFISNCYGEPDDNGDYVEPGVISFNGGEIVIGSDFVIRAISPAMFAELDALGIVHRATLDPHPLSDDVEIGGAS